MSRVRRKSSSCYNCETPLLNGENYCPNCGQENNSKQASTRQLLMDFVDTYLSFDSKLFMTIRPLLFKPGQLTKEYLDGKRAKYVPPIRLLIFLSFFYFGVSYLIGEGNGFNVSLDNTSNEDRAKFTELFQRNINLVILVFVPIHALIVMLFFRSKERSYYVNFFVFTLHLFSLLFILGIFLRTILIPFDQLVADESVGSIVASVIQLALLIYLAYYSVKSLKVIFAKKNTILRFIATLLISVVLFFATFIGYLAILMQLFEINEA